MQEVITNARLATFDHAGAPYGLVTEAAVAIESGVIRWVGESAALPEQYQGHARTDVGGRLVTPGLVDCHTHLVFGGNRAREFEMRLEGATYEEIARAGGGIVSTVAATRGASVEELVEHALPRVNALINEGVTTLEIKSGYGLDVETEHTMLRAARKLATLCPVRILTSWLGAHVVPKEYEGRDDAYIDEVCIPGLRSAHEQGLVDAVDGFCEGIAFTAQQMDRVFAAAAALSLPVKLHAEQLSNIGGVQMAARYGAISADHLEYATEDDAKAMAESGTVAVLLPGAFYFLRETQLPPIDAFRSHNVPMALATDFNPGSSPLSSLLLAMNMGCTLFRLTPEEALAGTTREGARALGLNDCGRIAAGLRADLAIWDVQEPAELSYRIGFNPLVRRIYAGA